MGMLRQCLQELRLKQSGGTAFFEMRWPEPVTNPSAGILLHPTAPSSAPDASQAEAARTEERHE